MAHRQRVDGGGGRRIAEDLRLSRRLEKRASLGRRDVSHLLAAAFTLHAQVVRDLLLVARQIVQTINLRGRVRQPAAAAHHSMKAVGIGSVERQKN